MSTVQTIKNFIHDLPDDEIFTTRDLVHLTTSRNALDVTIYRMINIGMLKRLARGVFMKNIPDQRIPTVEEVAVIKAKAFGKEIFQHGINAAAEIGLIEKKHFNRTRYLFYTTGCSSAFSAGQFRVRFRSVSKRKTNLSQNDAGKLLKAIWQQGKCRVKNMRNRALRLERNLNNLQRVLFRKEVRLMPIWLVRMFYPRGTRATFVDG